MNVMFSKGDLVQIPADAPYYKVDCDSEGEYYVRPKANKMPLLAIYLNFSERENKATVWMDNQKYKVGLKYIYQYREQLC